jgi:hypothetical protein
MTEISVIAGLGHSVLRHSDLFRASCFAFRIWSLFLMILMWVSASGCSGPNAASVSGTVTLDGQPLPGANVSFYPDGGSGAPAYGQTDAAGKYTLSTGTEAGLAPGQYVAVVVATKEPPQAYDATGAEAPPIPITPAKYGDVAKSDLKVEVKAGANEVPLALVSGKAGGS